jgi:hypothetical protein
VKTLVPTGLALALSLTACESTLGTPPPPPPPVDPCGELPPIRAQVVPDTVRVNGAATVSATGGSGRYTFTLTTAQSGGSLSGTRFVAGLTPGTDTILVADDCGGSALVSVEVAAAFVVQPTRATVQPGASFDIRVIGARGLPRVTAQGGALASGGSIAALSPPMGAAYARYTAGPTSATDVLLVQDSLTGEQAAIVVTVTPTAQFRPASPWLALPTESFIPLETLDGTGVVEWSLAPGAPGAIERIGGQVVYRAGTTSGTAVLTGRDELLGVSTTVTVRTLTELTRPGLRAQGRRSDQATLLAADFDGDGLDDVALGIPESDLARPQGGAVFIFKGTATGLPDAPTWIITGQTDTAQFGAVMAAGDLDGDGRADLAIAAPGDDVTIADSGAVYLYSIGPAGPRQLRPPLTGLGRGNFGAALTIADIDGDGDNDLIVGSPGADIAPGAGFTQRGVVDIFVLERGQRVPDLGAIRLGGWDVDADGGVRRTSNIRMGRGLVASDLNGDGRVDLAILGSVNNTLGAGADGGTLARNVIAAQVHLGRAARERPFEETPDLYVLPANTADGDEGNWKLDLVPAGQGRPALLAAAADRTDSPDLRAADAGVQGGSNGGGVLLFDLRAYAAAGAAPQAPPQVKRLDAWARVYGDQANIQATRGLAIADVDGDGSPELVLGAPYAARVDGNTTTPNVGRVALYSLSRLSAGAVVNRPDAVRAGANRTDLLGTAVTVWNGRVVAYNARATTALGDFTGRLDVFSAGADPSAWTADAIALPARPAAQQFGVGLDVGAVGGELRAIVGAPNVHGAASDSSGNEVGAGQAVAYRVPAPASPVVLHEGANTPYVTDGGWRAFGGRLAATDVAMTDFDGDGRLDIAIAASNFSLPTRLADGGVSSTEYAINRFECAAPSAQSPGAVLVHLAMADGTYREGFRLWGLRDIEGCVVPDGGAAAACQRSQLARNGLTGGLDFNGDGVGDLVMTRANGLEVFTGRAPDDPQVARPSMACDPLFSLPFIAQATSMPTALGDLDGDGCDEVGLRYSDNANRQGFIVAFGFDTGGTRCNGVTEPRWVRVSGDTETGVATMRLGVALARARGVLRDGTDAVAVSADLYPYQGMAQPTVLLVPVSQLVAKRPTSGGVLVSILGDGLAAVPLVPQQRVLGFGRALAGNVDFDGDGRAELVVSAPGANVNGDGTGAVYVFKGGTVTEGPNRPWMLIAPDFRERASFGQDLALSRAAGGAPAALGIGAPLSYRSGTANGTAFVLPLDFSW